MRPRPSVVTAPAGLAVEALVEEGRQYAVYLHAPVGEGSITARTVEVSLDLPAGRYAVEWLSPKTGTLAPGEPFDHPGGRKSLTWGAFDEDLALAVRAR
jgi:hypothetical protein